MVTLYTLPDLIKMKYDKYTLISGIYIWGFCHKGNYIPLYVGKAKYIPKRIFEHLCAWRGGAYRVPQWEDIASVKGKWKILYEPKSFKDFARMLNNPEIKRTISEVGSKFFCCWQVLSVYDEKLARAYEKEMARLLLNKYNLISHTGDPISQQNAQSFARSFYNDYLEICK